MDTTGTGADPKNPSPEQFFGTFLAVVRSEQRTLLENWADDPSHTKVMKEIVRTVARALGLECSAEYWGYDAVFYREKDTAHFPNPASTYAKCISAAIEHENEWTTAVEEMNKLQLLNTPLTVLITYPQREENQRKLLERFTAIVRDGDIFQNASTSRKQLVIFGFQPTEWKAFVYCDGRFALLESAQQAEA